jgi:hypothetical protein
MYSVDEQPETLHIYVVREAAPKPQLFPIVLSVLVLCCLVALAVAVPYQQQVTRAIIRVPTVPLGIKTFTASVAVIPTGTKTYPATTAHGVLTITNGSIIGQTIPTGFTIQGVVTDGTVYVPPGNANGYGWAQVRAHAIEAGHGGDVSPYAINSVIGSSVYVRNLSAFRGGRDSYSVKAFTAQDRSEATVRARSLLLSVNRGLHYPCIEAVRVRKAAVRMSWRCQMITYHIASFYHVTGIRIIGRNLLLSVWFIPHPIRYWVK